MCAMLRELSIPVSDLSRVVMKCGNCGAEITFDLIEAKSVTPGACSSCGVPFDMGAQESIDGLRNAYKAITKQRTITVSFRVKAEDRTF